MFWATLPQRWKVYVFRPVDCRWWTVDSRYVDSRYVWWMPGECPGCWLLPLCCKHWHWSRYGQCAPHSHPVTNIQALDTRTGPSVQTRYPVTTHQLVLSTIYILCSVVQNAWKYYVLHCNSFIQNYSFTWMLNCSWGKHVDQKFFQLWMDVVDISMDVVLL